MIIWREEALTINRGLVSAEVERMLRAALTIPNPAYTKAKALGLKRLPPATLDLLSEDEEGRLVIPRGFETRLRHGLETLGVLHEFRTPTNRKFGRAVSANHHSLWPHQSEAYEAWENAGRDGIFVIPTGGGKSYLTAALIDEIAGSALILVDRRSLLHQWMSVLESHTLRDVVEWSDGDPLPPILNLSRTVVVATIQTVYKRTLPDPSFFDLVVLDECHHVSAQTYADVISRLNPIRLLGLSATPEGNQGLGEVVENYLGPPIYEVSRETLEQQGIIMPFNYTSITFSGEHGVPRSARSNVVWQEARKAVHNSEDRAFFVARWISKLSQSRRVVVHSNEIVALDLLQEQLTRLGLGSATYLWTSKEGNYNSAFHHIQANWPLGPRVLLTTMLGEGVDIPRLDTLIMFSPMRGEAPITQLIGRIVRVTAGDKPTPVVVDVVDSTVGMLVAQSRDRHEIYRDLGARFVGSETLHDH
jgi:superfamily II DNA or RNA helicase